MPSEQRPKAADMGKKSDKCCKKYKQGKRCKHCPKRH
jgi:hypothetical protein